MARRHFNLPLDLAAVDRAGAGDNRSAGICQSWNEYLFALNFTATNPSAQTVPVAIAQFSGQFSEQEPIAEIMAAAMVVTVPLVVLVLIFQNRIVEGLTAGAVKGQ